MVGLHNTPWGIRDGQVGETMKFVSEEDGLDVYLDLETSQECFRPQTGS